MNRQSVQKYIHALAPQPTSLKPRGRLREAIKCLLVDVYGTLFISGSGDIGPGELPLPKMGELQALLSQFGIAVPPRALLKELRHAIEARHAQLQRRGVDFPEVKIDRIWMQVLQNNDKNFVRRFALEFELIVNPVYPMPNLAAMLAACREQKIRLGIISNAQFYTPCLFQWFLKATPAALGFDPELAYYSYRFGIAKPSPRLFAMAAEKLAQKGIRPSSALYLGNDLGNDIYPAHITGFQTALFAGDRRSLRLRSNDPRCKNLKPELVITDLGQLADHIHARQ